MITEAIVKINSDAPILSENSLPNNFRNSTQPIVMEFKNFNPEAVTKNPRRFIMTEKVLGAISIEFYELNRFEEDYYVKPISDTNIAALIKSTLSVRVNVDLSFQEKFRSYESKINKEFSVLQKMPINLIVESVEKKLMVTRIMVNPEKLSGDELEGLYKIIWEEYHKNNNIVDNNVIESRVATTERIANSNKLKKKPSKMLQWRREFRERQDTVKSTVVEVNRIEVSHEQYLKSLEELRKRGVLI